MRLKPYKLLLLALALLSTVSIGLIVRSPEVRADTDELTVQTNCDPDKLPSYTGIVNLEPQAYDVFVRLGKRGQQANARSYIQPQEGGNCLQLSQIQATGDRWQKVGDFTAAQNKSYLIQLSSSALDEQPDANRPAVMLVPRHNPICVPNVECEVDLFGQRGYIRPAGTLLNQDSLHVLVVSDPNKAKIGIVRYYVDDKLAYTTSALQPFDLRYVSYPQQKLKRVIEYQTGQQVVLPDTAPSTHRDTFANTIFRLGKSYPTLLTTLLILVCVLVLIGAGLAIMHAVWHQRNWQYSHGLLHKKEHQLSVKERQLLYRRQRILQISRISLTGVGLAVSIILFIILTSTYVAQIFRVDGRSMRNTMFTGEKMLVSKISSTLASTNGREYVPKRGDVVVARAVFGASSLTHSSTDNYFIIKRVIGLPGERVVVKNGVLTVYNQEHPDGFQPDKNSPWSKTMVPNEPTEQLDVQLSSSELFLSGDNRPESIDSRFNGPIATQEIVGRSVFKLWPLFGHRQPAD